jgi:tetratricopeptide (TPR) repeat protein
MDNTLSQIRKLVEAGNLDEAESALLDALKAAPDSWDLLDLQAGINLRIGTGLWEKGDVEGALDYFTSDAFLEILRRHDIDISMDGKGRWLDNAFVERLWRSVKYEDVYLKAYGSIAEARHGLREYFEFYNRQRRHQSLDRRTPDDVYWSTLPQKKVAA